MGTTYNCTGSKELPLAWRCPKCGKLNLSAYRISATASHRNKDRAEERMRSVLEEKSLNTVLDVENRRFDRVRFRNNCANCAACPAWSNLPEIPPKALRILRNVSLIAAVIITGYSNSQSSSSAGWKWMLLSLAVIALFAVLALVCLLSRRRTLKDKALEVDALPPENQPWIAQSLPELKQRLVEERLLTTEEMNALGSSGSSDANYGRNLSQEYRARAENRKSKDRTRQILCIAISVIALVFVCGVQFNNFQTARWEEKMDNADLLTANPTAGDKFIVQEKLRSGNARFVKKYLASDQLAAVPEEVGYIIVIEDSTTVVGSYTRGSFKAGNAYRVNSTLRLFDRHTGSFIGDPVLLRGGDPPKSVKSSAGSGYGSRPDPTQTVKELVKSVQ